MLEPEDKMEIIVGNQTLQRVGNVALVPDTDKPSNIATVVSSVIAIRDAFDEIRTPDVCVVSNNELNFKNLCRFSVFMSPKIIELDEQRGEMFFTCCADNETFPSLWWYTENTTITSIDTEAKEHQFVIHVETYLQGNHGHGGGDTVILICGREHIDGLMLFGVGKIILNMRYGTGASISGKIERGRIASSVNKSHDSETKCSDIFNIIIASISLENEATTRITELITITASDPDVSTPKATSADQEDGYEAWITICIVFVFSLLFNVAVCTKKCFDMISSRKNSRGAENQIGNNRRAIHLADNMYEDDTLERNISSMELNRLSEPDRTSLHVYETTEPESYNASKLDRRNRNEEKPVGSLRSTSALDCANLTPIAGQTSPRDAVHYGPKDTFMTEAPRRNELSYDEDSATYHEISKHDLLMNTTNNSFHITPDDANYADCDFQVLASLTDKEDFSHTPVIQSIMGAHCVSPNYPDGLYAVPDKLPKSKINMNISTGSSCSAGCFPLLSSNTFDSEAAATASTSNYDSLRRPSIERNLELYEDLSK